ncbi:MAG: hypothetical protein NC548_59325 [Lachnospiraceae bacterium]|nr:hypothetical protein [Lachnospiraceae bacterium]
MSEKDEKNLIAEDAEEQVSAPKYLGKFDTADELASAYNALESEFTKRCQLVKQLQTELSLLRAQAESVAPAAVQNDPIQHTDEDGTTDARHEKPTVEGEPYVVMHSPRAEQISDGRTECAQGDCREDRVSDEILLCAAEYADVLSGIPEIMSACITRYKQKLLEARGSGSPAGMAVIVPAKRPVTLAEAKKLADEMLAL